MDQHIELDNETPNTTASLYRTYNTTGTIQLQTGEGKLGFVQGEVTQNSYDIFSGSLSATKSGVGTSDITANGVQLQNNSASTFLKNNYSATFEKGTLTVTDDLSNDDVETEIENGDGEGDDKPSYDEESDTWTLTYDGKTHEITKVKKGETVIPAQDESGTANYSISYSYQATAESEATDLEEGDEIKNAGTYTATIEFKNGYSGTKTQTIIIKTRDLTVDLNIPETIEPDQSLEDLSGWWTKDKIELIGIVAEETENAKASFTNASVSITGPLTSGEPVDVVVKNVKLEDKDSFLTSNYNITYKNGETTTISNWEDLDDTPNDGDENDTTIDDGTTVGKIEIDPSEDGDDITGGEDNTDPKDDDLDDPEDFVMIVPDGEGEISVYDGKTHELSLLIIKKDDGTIYKLKQTEDYSVTYTGDGLNDEGKPLHAGSYTATVTLNEGSKYQIKDNKDNSFTLTIQIKERPLEVYLNIPATIKENQNLEDLSSWWSPSKITFNEGGFANDTEKNAAVSTLSSAKASISELPDVGESADVKLMDIDFSDATPFFKSNYAITYYKGSTKVEGENVDLSDQDSDGTNDDASITDGTEVEDSDKITIDPTDPDTDITGGEDTDEDEDLDDKDYILVSTGDGNDGNDVNAVYDGETHTIEYMVVTVDGKTYKLNATEDFTVSYTGEGLENGQPHDAGTYTASIEMIGKYTGNFDLNVTIKKRSLAVYFNFPLAIYDKNQISWSKDLITYKGLVEGETPAIPDECHLEVRGNRVWLVDFAFNDDPASEFETDNYIVNYQGNTGDITVNINEGTDDDHDGDIDVELPDGDIDLNPDDDPNHGGGDHGGSGINRPVHYYNIYVDTAATCDGVELSFSKEVVREGNQVSVYIDKILEGYNANDMKLWFKRSLFGYWEELEEGVQPGEYIIDHIYTDIYVKVTDVEHLPTGLEEVEGAKVYTQDGSIYVYTPSRMPVWIVSMTGALLRNEEQVGLQSYDRLTRGIYIVRVGEQVFKIQLK